MTIPEGYRRRCDALFIWVVPVETLERTLVLTGMSGVGKLAAVPKHKQAEW